MHEIADTQDSLLDNGVTASAKRLDARQEFDQRKGLDQMVIAPGAQATHPTVDFPSALTIRTGAAMPSPRN